MTAIAGPNGAGKSTLLKAIMGELPLAEGSIDRCGLSPCDFGYLPQAAEIDRQVSNGGCRHGHARSLAPERCLPAHRSTVGLHARETL